MVEDASQVNVEPDNYIRVSFPSRSENESFARVAVASFAAQLDPTMEQLTELKTAVSEAVTNAIIHGYPTVPGEIRIYCAIAKGSVEVVVEDDGVGIGDLDQAREAMYTSRPELERSGMGITIIENFVDELHIDSTPGKGTRVVMRKQVTLPPVLYA